MNSNYTKMMEDPIYYALWREWMDLPEMTCSIENADICAAMADRCEELGLMDRASDYRRCEKQYRERACKK